MGKVEKQGYSFCVNGTAPGIESTQMLQYRTRAEVLPNPCNCGFLENQGLQKISLYVKLRFCLETHVADCQRCRPAFAEAPALRKASGGGASRRQVQGFGKIFTALCGDFPAKPHSTPARFRYCFLQLAGLLSGRILD